MEYDKLCGPEALTKNTAQGLTKHKNKQQPKVWPSSPSAHRSVLGDSPLYPGGLQAASGGSSPTWVFFTRRPPRVQGSPSKGAFTHLSIGKDFARAVSINASIYQFVIHLEIWPKRDRQQGAGIDHKKGNISETTLLVQGFLFIILSVISRTRINLDMLLRHVCSVPSISCISQLPNPSSTIDNIIPEDPALVT